MDMEEKLVGMAKKILERRNAEILDEPGKLRLVIRDGDYIALVVIEPVSEFTDTADITQSEFESFTRRWMASSLVEGDLHLRLDSIQCLSIDGTDKMQVKYVKGQTSFREGDEEERLIKSLISMTLVQDENTEAQTKMVKALRERLEEI